MKKVLGMFVMKEKDRARREEKSSANYQKLVQKRVTMGQINVNSIEH